MAAPPSSMNQFRVCACERKNICDFSFNNQNNQKNIFLFSCDDFEKTISEKYPDVFNSNSKDADETPFQSRDSRSDDQVS